MANPSRYINGGAGLAVLWHQLSRYGRVHYNSVATGECFESLSFSRVLADVPVTLYVFNAIPCTAYFSEEKEMDVKNGMAFFLQKSRKIQWLGACSKLIFLDAVTPSRPVLHNVGNKASAVETVVWMREVGVYFLHRDQSAPTKGQVPG